MLTLEENIERQQNDPFVGKYTVMVSSSVLDFETDLDVICSYLRELGYNVVCSKEGTLSADSRFNNFDNCYKAAENCDLFLGIIRPYMGSGKDKNGKSVTFNEFIHARKAHRPCWYIIDKRIDWTDEFSRALELRQIPKGFSKVFTWLWKCNYRWMKSHRHKMPHLLDLFKEDRSRRFSPECFEMKNFVNQKGIYAPEDNEIRNNWMQYCYGIQEMKTWIKTNFGNRAMIEENVREA